MVSSRLSVSFQGVKSYMHIFNWAGALVSLTPMLLKDRSTVLIPSRSSLNPFVVFSLLSQVGSSFLFRVPSFKIFLSVIVAFFKKILFIYF